MDKSAVESWVNENLDQYKSMMGLERWRFGLFYEQIDETYGMTIQTLPEYELARITIDFEKMKDIQHVEECFLHEMMHIMHSPYEIAWKIASKLLDDDKSLETLEAAWHHAEEMTVRNLLHMHKSLTNMMAVDSHSKLKEAYDYYVKCANPPYTCSEGVEKAFNEEVANEIHNILFKGESHESK